MVTLGEGTVEGARERCRLDRLELEGRDLEDALIGFSDLNALLGRDLGRFIRQVRRGRDLDGLAATHDAVIVRARAVRRDLKLAGRVLAAWRGSRLQVSRRYGRRVRRMSELLELQRSMSCTTTTNAR